jgi:LysM repeat protein
MPYPYRCFEYVAEAGDTYASIAKVFSIPENELREYNKDAAISQGVRLNIPAVGGGCVQGAFYMISAADTLYRIARRYGIPLDILLSANPYLNPAYYLPGQVIIIPRAKKALAYYTLGKGERLVDVLRKYNMDLSMFCALNQGVDALHIKEGDRVSVRKLTGCLFRRYKMKTGDSIVSVAAKFGISAGELLGANGNLKPSAIVPGAALRIPLRHIGC